MVANSNSVKSLAQIRSFSSSPRGFNEDRERSQASESVSKTSEEEIRQGGSCFFILVVFFGLMMPRLFIILYISEEAVRYFFTEKILWYAQKQS